MMLCRVGAWRRQAAATSRRKRSISSRSASVFCDMAPEAESTLSAAALVLSTVVASRDMLLVTAPVPWAACCTEREMSLVAAPCCSTALAMEAVQETWLRVIRHSRTYDGRASVKTWVYQIAMNRCRDLGRSRSASKKRERVHHDRLQDEKKAHVIPTASPIDPRLEAAVGALEEHQRETVILCYHRGLTHRQAAEVLGVPMGTIKSRLNKALEKLRESLGTQDAVPGRGVEA